jgi:hypothetical protein
MRIGILLPHQTGIDQRSLKRMAVPPDGEERTAMGDDMSEGFDMSGEDDDNVPPVTTWAERAQASWGTGGSEVEAEGEAGWTNVISKRDTQIPAPGDPDPEGDLPKGLTGLPSLDEMMMRAKE